MKKFLVSVLGLSMCGMSVSEGAMKEMTGYMMTPPPWQLFNAVKQDYVTLDAENEKTCSIFISRQAKNISVVGFETNIVTTGTTVDVRLESVDTSGHPSGVLIGTDTRASQVITAADDHKWVETTLTSPYASSIGEVIAVCVVNPTISFGNLRISRSGDLVGGGEFTGFQSTWSYTGGAWSALDDFGQSFYLENTDGSAVFTGGAPITTITKQTFSSTSNPDERGVTFSLDFPMRVCGAWITVDQNGDTFDVVLYDTDGTTVLRSFSYIKNYLGNRVNPDRNSYSIWEGVNLPINNPSTPYRLVFKPTGTIGIQIITVGVNSPKIWNSFTFGQSMVKTTRNNESAWTQTNTERPVMGLIVCGAEDNQ